MVAAGCVRAAGCVGATRCVGVAGCVGAVGCVGAAGCIKAARSKCSIAAIYMEAAKYVGAWYCVLQTKCNEVWAYVTEQQREIESPC